MICPMCGTECELRYIGPQSDGGPSREYACPNMICGWEEGDEIQKGSNMTKMLILIAESSSGEELQVLVCEDEFKGEPADFFVGDVKDPHVAGRIECEGDTLFLGGVYNRE